jgi:hypothetical protein
MKKSTSHHINPHANTSTAPPTTSAGSQSGNLRCRQSPRTHSNFSPPPQPHRFTCGDKDASGRRMAWRARAWQAQRRVSSEDVQARAWNAQAWRRRRERARAREREHTRQLRRHRGVHKRLFTIAGTLSCSRLLRLLL